jgi:hypothetical protein
VIIDDQDPHGRIPEGAVVDKSSAPYLAEKLQPATWRRARVWAGSEGRVATSASIAKGYGNGVPLFGIAQSQGTQITPKTIAFADKNYSKATSKSRQVRGYKCLGNLKFLTSLAEGYLAFPVHHKTLPIMRQGVPLANEAD